MPNYVYVAAQDTNQIVVLTINDETGRLTPQAEIPMAGGPSLLAISPNRHCLYVGHRAAPEISSHRIDPETGGLTHLGSITPPDPAGFLATDRSGRYLLVAYYQGGSNSRRSINPSNHVTLPTGFS
jgi:6-phosphogluconolactonase